MSLKSHKMIKNKSQPMKRRKAKTIPVDDKFYT